MVKIDGKHIAAEILTRLKSLPRPGKFFAAVLVGNDKSSVSFLAQKEKVARELGVDFRLYKFPADAGRDKLRAEVRKISQHKTCGGMIVQLPLPERIDPHYVLNAIPQEKDVDVLSERAFGAFYAGRSKILPPAVGTVQAIVEHCESQIENCRLEIENSTVAVVGLGLLVGRPVATWIMRRAKETILLRSTSDLGVLTHADLVVTGVGKAGLITPDMLKAGAGVIDFGYDENRGDFDAAGRGQAHISSYTPTPGGTGPILVAKVFENFYTLTAHV